MGKFVDLSGRTYNQWTVLRRDPVQKTNLINWICECSCGNVKSVSGANVTKGLSKSCGRCSQVIYGFGINDLNRIVNNDPVYFTWKRMVERCYGEKSLIKYPTYLDKSVNEVWKFASSFEKWMLTQPWEGMELDKDLLVLNNKEYSPETCCFVPKRVNLVLGISEGKRGDYPLGVCHHNDGPNQYLARSAQKYLGIFSNIESAHKAWQKSKAQDILDVIDWWHFTPEVNHTFNQKVADNLIKISDKILQDRESGIETKKLI